MPTPDRTSLDEIVRAGDDILESDGPVRLTMRAVAERVGVRPPSLYKRMKNRQDLVGLILQATLGDLGDTPAAVEARTADEVGAGGAGVNPRRVLAEMAHAVRVFAHDRPAGFALLFASRTDPARPDAEMLTNAVAPVLRVAAELTGDEHALEAARTITARKRVHQHGAGRCVQPRRDADRAYEFGISTLTAALAGNGRRSG